MAEAPQPFGTNQRTLIIASAAIVVAVLLIFFIFRSCGPAGDGYTVIYSGLDLSDAAKVIARLKELKISYQVKDQGTAVAVPKDQADSARLGLAEKNLPSGGVVGWEIFNETRMGATDFDRRIQLIRAISGELSRTIKRIEGVEDARVQIVLPETRLFEVTKAPVTASVLLKLSAGFKLKSEQIRGIIYLVASSVENLKPVNVTVVDESGKILSALVPIALPTAPSRLITSEVTAKIKTMEKTKTATAEALSEEQKALLRLKAKEEYERQLTSNSQSLLNKFMPTNTAVAQVVVEFGLPIKALKSYTHLKIRDNSHIVNAQIKKIKVIVLIDKKYNLTSTTKKDIFKTMSLAVPYNRKRGDRIILRRVPFHYAVPTDLVDFKEVPKEPAKKSFVGWIIFGLFIIVSGIILIFIIMRRAEPAYLEEEIEVAAPPTEEEAGSAVDQIKDIAGRNPEKIAELLKKWLSESEEAA